MPPLSADLSLFFAAVASLLSNVLRSDKLPRMWNIVIALCGLLVCAGLSVWLTVGFTNDVQSNVGLLIVAGVGLSLKEGFDLLNYIRGAASPLQALIPPHMEPPPLPIVQKGNTIRANPPEQVL
jgi:hypothetical protein